jgi:ppGpp synthetase/RelA/SpoT-type nucleotidyltranferase
MAEFPHLEVELAQVRAAGEALRGAIPWETEEDKAKALDIFRIAHNWRASHVYPMNRVRYQLGGLAHRNKHAGLTVARLKMMPSIRRKLKSTSLNLDKIQDLGGCRAIMPSISDVKALVDECRQELPHALRSESPYIDKPRASGYRSHHLMFDFEPHTGDSREFAGRRIEVQIRTRLQHSWATAVEAVGTLRQEDLKAGKGDKQWLRLFELMASELALAEGCSEVPGAAPRNERVAEIKAIDAELKAANTLENLSQAFKYLDTYYRQESQKFFVIKYNNENCTVQVESFNIATAGTKSFDRAEIFSETHSQHIKSVLVEAESIRALKEAYPNYFGDVQIFKRNLADVVRGKQAREYTMPPQEVAPPPLKAVPDTAWFLRPRFRKPKGV